MSRALRALALVALAAAWTAAAELRISKHARQRMIERGVTEQQVREIIETVEPFEYRHQRRTKTGYYDDKTRIFLATADGILITVVADATPRYVRNLKGKKR